MMVVFASEWRWARPMFGNVIGSSLIAKTKSHFVNRPPTTTQLNFYPTMPTNLLN